MVYLRFGFLLPSSTLECGTGLLGVGMMSPQVAAPSTSRFSSTWSTLVKCTCLSQKACGELQQRPSAIAFTPTVRQLKCLFVL